LFRTGLTFLSWQDGPISPGCRIAPRGLTDRTNPRNQTGPKGLIVRTNPSDQAEGMNYISVHDSTGVL
jgi:hypothetical protein